MFIGVVIISDYNDKELVIYLLLFNYSSNYLGCPNFYKSVGGTYYVVSSK